MIQAAARSDRGLPIHVASFKLTARQKCAGRTFSRRIHALCVCAAGHYAF